MILTTIKLKIGSSYVLYDDWKIECLFIKTSPMGYNFLNLKTYKCVLKKSISIKKYTDLNSDGYNSFLVPKSMKIWELNKESEIK